MGAVIRWTLIETRSLIVSIIPLKSMMRKLPSAVVLALLLLMVQWCVAADSVAPGKPVSFKEDVAPILVSKCLGCHGAERARGRFQLHTFEKLMTAGASKSPSIAPHNPQKSELFRLITSNDPDERM